MNIFMPDMYCKSIYNINYDLLKSKGIKCILFDLDNTIAPYEQKSPNKNNIQLVEKLEDMGFKVIIISNSGIKRVGPFKDILNVDAAHSAKKPLKTKYKKIIKLYGFKQHEIAAVGDQLLTDIYGANRMGITSILINQMSKNDLQVTKVNRVIENMIFNNFEKKGLFKVGDYYD